MIEFKSILKMSLVSLKVNKMRSMLTSLGIIIGVSAVIIMLAVGSGASAQVQKEVNAMGSNVLTIRSGSAKSGGARQGMGSTPTLTIKDANAIASSIQGVDSVSVASSENKQLTYGNQNWSTSVYGIMPQYLYIKNYEIDLGRGLSFDDNRNTAKTILLGSTVVNELFGDLDPIGRVVRVGNVPFKVVGTLKSKGSSGPFDQDDLAFIPIATAQRKVFGTAFPGTVSMILVKGENPDTLDAVQSEIEILLRNRHNISKNQDDDFKIRNSAEFQEMRESNAKTFAILLAAIASVSLIVGGIGIMNIMLVSVTERTKEIGIRMAIGAKASDIRLQFLFEALILSLAGGVIGIFVGIFGSKIVDLCFALPTSISILSIVLSFVFSGIVGIGFGFYPAYKASLLNPIDALRYE